MERITRRINGLRKTVAVFAVAKTPANFTRHSAQRYAQKSESNQIDTYYEY